MKKILKSKKKKRESYSSLEMSFLSVMMLLLGILLGVIFCYCKINVLDSSDSKLHEIISTYNNIINNSYGEVDKDKLADGAMSGMMDSLDDSYSDFLSEDETKSLDDSINGYYEGVGITITLDDKENVVIMNVVEGSPAAKAGIKENDILISVDEMDAKKSKISDIASYVTKVKGKTINIKVNRNGKELDFKVKKSRVDMPSVSSEIFGDVGYLEISNFALNTGEQFKKELKGLKDDEINSLIIDLRDNPGGSLAQVKDILEPFFKKNTVLYQIQYKNGKTKIKTTNKDKMDIPVVILINERTASASEIVASCFKENYKNVTLVGKMTYGKGTIQKEVKLSTGSSIKYTTQRWLTSKGQWLNHDKEIGIKPDIEVDICQDSECKLDMQLEKAKSILKKSS